MSQLLVQEDPDFAQRYQLAQAMMQRGQDSSPVGHWTQGLDRVLNAGLGAYQMSQLEKQQAEQRQQNQQLALAHYLGS